ncbi:hypothetical protein C2845_PM17G14460 [Panicum miliaceum]|uniref:F-box domain-containing protein n=1 Tax=Panicum miliaceum TaxID=4540 RepID=A0A3L6Q1J4_PANMI|nr:hypothetical protein C2845_PM17G14460 [Panicum miliaceum]
MATDTVAAPALPDDVLEDILGRLPARSLAASQCVCKAWRDVVGERGLLLRLRRLLPHSVAGLFVNYIDHHRPHFFARPRPPADGGGPQIIDGRFSFIVREKPYEWYTVLDHCNGLVLHSGDHFGDKALYLCNPTTRWWARLPPRSDFRHWKRRALVAFDPAVSPHWEVLLAPLEPHKLVEKQPGKRKKNKKEKDGDGAWRAMEWPPATWPWHVFSSTTMLWEEKVFVREGEAAGTVADLLLHSLGDHSYDTRWRYGAYWQGALYMHCRGEYVTRLSLSSNKYQVIISPIDLAECQRGAKSFIGRSANGVCFGALDTMPGFVFGSSTNHQMSGTEDEEASEEDGMEWNSDDDDIIDPADDENEYDYYRHVTFLGFHPYKEVIFLDVIGSLGMACHLDSGKVQYLVFYGKYIEIRKGKKYSCVSTPHTKRLSLSDNRYQIIKSPIDPAKVNNEVKTFIGKSEKGVYFGTIDDCQLQVWILNDRTEWVLCITAALNLTLGKKWIAIRDRNSMVHGSWMTTRRGRRRNGC